MVLVRGGGEKEGGGCLGRTKGCLSFTLHLPRGGGVGRVCGSMLRRHLAPGSILGRCAFERVGLGRQP